MSIGKQVRLQRIFSHPSGRLCSVAMDHFFGYDMGLPPGLQSIVKTLDAVVEGHPDAVTLHHGLATAVWHRYAGKVPLVVQSTIFRLDDSTREQLATAEDAVRLGADAFAVGALVRGASEGSYLRTVADCVRDAHRYEMPLICHIYPRDYTGDAPRISFAPEDIAWAVRCAVEVGVDVVKTPYCGDVKAYAQIVADCPMPLVAAGGPQAARLEAALQMMGEVVASGARGATIGRNIWGTPQIAAAVQAFKAVVHDNATPGRALECAGLSAN
jgi:class I fructose-bisphosphate aldolase